jgi:hypothetical protein
VVQIIEVTGFGVRSAVLRRARARRAITEEIEAQS